VDHEFMLGPSILVCPVSSPGATTVDALLPKGTRWFCAHSGAENKTPGASAGAKLQARPAGRGRVMK
jgi:alpha-glucosidase (family GH31 glycosyl hydrolase)